MDPTLPEGSGYPAASEQVRGFLPKMTDFRLSDWKNGHPRHCPNNCQPLRRKMHSAPERQSGHAAYNYCADCRADPFLRQAAGGLPTWRLKARLKAYSDS